MLTREQYLLIKLAEECNEVAQRVSKALCFGLQEVQPGQDLTNARRITLEMSDLYGVFTMLSDEHFLEECSWDDIHAKRDKVKKFMEYSRELGVLEKEGQE